MTANSSATMPMADIGNMSSESRIPLVANGDLGLNLQLLAILMVTLVVLRLLLGSRDRKKPKLPPGPRGWPLVGNLFQVTMSGKPFMYVVRDLREQFGSIFMLRMGQRIMIIITSPELAHEALIEKGAVFANRPPETPTRILFSENKCTVNSAEYGSLWRALRRNMVTEMLNPTRVKDFSWIREWAIERLIQRLKEEADSNGGVVQVMTNVRFTVFSILLCMCFGKQLAEDVISGVDETLKEVLLTVEPQIHDFLPILGPLFWRQKRRAIELREMQIRSILPLINERREVLKNGHGSATAYIDSLFELELEGRDKLTAGELVTLCSELLNAGTDTTATTLEWAMLHLVLDPKIQAKVQAEISSVVGPDRKVDHKDIDRLPYLNAVVKETLRRHPPGHFVLSHAVTEDCKLAGFDIPTKASVEFYTAWISYNPDVWADPMEFRPERFLEDGVDFDITGNKHVKMMPFGVGRRICPGLSLGMLHINLILARMVQAFQWSPRDGETPDLTEKFAFTVIMKNPLHASINPRE
eukprot:Gb_37693 [translate_table: standard]